MKIDNWSERLPGGELVRKGLEDYTSGRRSVPACLVGIGYTRLRRAGLLSPTATSSIPEPERELYRLLCEAGGDAYSRYNALVREFVSFEQALDRLR